MDSNIHELPRPSVRQLDILNGGETVLQQFSERIHQSNGELWWLVHPNFIRLGNGFTGVDPYQPPEDYKQRRDILIKDVISQGKIPMLISQEKEKMRELATLLGNGTEGTVFVFPTKINSPYPDNGKYNQPRFSWDSITDTLHQAGVKTIHLGGAILLWHEAGRYNGSIAQVGSKEYPDREAQQLIRQYAENIKEKLGHEPLAMQWIDQNLIPQHCVGGTAIDMLREGFDVDLSLPHCAIQR